MNTSKEKQRSLIERIKEQKILNPLNHGGKYYKIGDKFWRENKPTLLSHMEFNKDVKALAYGHKNQAYEYRKKLNGLKSTNKSIKVPEITPIEEIKDDEDVEEIQTQGFLSKVEYVYFYNNGGTLPAVLLHGFIKIEERLYRELLKLTTLRGLDPKECPYKIILNSIIPTANLRDPFPIMKYTSDHKTILYTVLAFN